MVWYGNYLNAHCTAGQLLVLQLEYLILGKQDNGRQKKGIVSFIGIEATVILSPIKKTKEQWQL